MGRKRRARREHDRCIKWWTCARYTTSCDLNTDFAKTRFHFQRLPEKTIITICSGQPHQEIIKYYKQKICQLIIVPLGYLREIRDRGDDRSCPLSQNCGPGVNTAFPCLSQLQACSLVNLLQRVQMKEGHAHTFNFTPNPLEYRYFPQYVLILRPFHKTFFFFFRTFKNTPVHI